MPLHAKRSLLLEFRMASLDARKPAGNGVVCLMYDPPRTPLLNPLPTVLIHFPCGLGTDGCTIATNKR